MSKKTGFIVVLLFSLILTIITRPVMLVQAKPPLKFAIKRQEQRNNSIQFESIIDALNITKGMTILDIGSGPGYASFLFAEKLRGSGEVFATDIREDFVNYITDEAKRRGLTNLFSALVKTEGFDAFYEEHRYDLVFVANVYHVIENRVEYFGKLRNLLRPDARLVLVVYNQSPLFSVDDLTDIEGLINFLSEETENNPFVLHLSNSTRLQLLEEKTDRAAIASGLVNDFNQMLADPNFYENFYKNSYFNKDMFSASDREFANWLLMTLKEDDVFVRPFDQLDQKKMRSVIRLNRLFFKSRLGDYLANSGMGVYIPAGDANRHTSKYVMFQELNAAGYKFSNEIKTSSYFDTVIMVPDTLDK